jgi:hypothetical protein
MDDIDDIEAILLQHPAKRDGPAVGECRESIMESLIEFTHDTKGSILGNTNQHQAALRLEHSPAFTQEDWDLGCVKKLQGKAGENAVKTI